MKHQNRISDTPIENMPVARERPPSIRAIQVWAWRCPNCTLMRLSEKSSTNETVCGGCGNKFTVEIR